jgi:hypothetical protein
MSKGMRSGSIDPTAVLKERVKTIKFDASFGANTPPPCTRIPAPTFVVGSPLKQQLPDMNAAALTTAIVQWFTAIDGECSIVRKATFEAFQVSCSRS